MLQIREYETDTDQALVCIVYDDPTLLFGTADQSAGIYSIVEMIDILVRSSWPRHMSGALYLISPDSTIIQIPLPRSEHALAQCKKYLLDRAYETITKDVPIRTNGYIGDLRESMVYVFRGTNTVDITPLLIDSSRIVEIEMAYPSHFIQREGLEISTLSGSRILDDEGVVSSKIQRLSPFHTRSRYVLGGDTYEFLQRTLHP